MHVWLPIALAVAAALAGCAPTRYTWVRPDAGYAQTQQDLARCEYEVASSTATYGSSAPLPYSYSAAIGQGIGQGIGRALESNRLIALCMRARGYAALLDGAPPAAPASAPAPAAPPLAASAPPGPISAAAPVPASALPPAPYAPPGATRVPGESRFQLTAESLAKAQGCVPPFAVMVGKGGGLETFKIGCPNGRVLSVNCEGGACDVMR